ncbi:Crp/Fnr family transcriptional regulator [Lichenifustis flavocetrariae]|uniref:Crp/Fnr family transcriptional regulator n=1 Tax=Lichenifustis flavocetrariae TaxID=2949735 RepID=A0AA41Z0N9_9HYPH|nr:Crp/Fnr family transcriptional regulator [Lichenifustis flavocetrariae]MCW6510796.1 Crp/Fnr family transcriptional regulator [Lichenifustis flavocetrariae]
MRSFPADQEIVRDGDDPDHCCLLIEGFMHCYKQLETGKRQIVSFHIPGDLPDLQTMQLNVMDHALGTLTPCVVAFIPHRALHLLVGEFPNLAVAFWRDSLINAAIFREWVVNVGCRPGPQRLAHLFCELFYRLETVGLAHKDGCEMPLTQAVLGDATGLSSVHVNRMMQDLRGRGLIATKAKFLQILDREKLQDFAGFDPTYLHMKEVLSP